MKYSFNVCVHQFFSSPIGNLFSLFFFYFSQVNIIRSYFFQNLLDLFQKAQVVFRVVIKEVVYRVLRPLIKFHVSKSGGRLFERETCLELPC